MKAMKTKKRVLRRPSLKSIYIHHIAWGATCVILLAVLLGFWYNAQTLNKQNAALQTKLSTLNTSEPSCTARDSWEASTTKDFSLLTKDGTRHYLVHLPQDFNKNVYYPLIIHFPGKGASATGGEKQAGLNVLPAIIAYPQPTVGKDGFTAWEGAPYSSGADDVNFTSAILDKLISQLCVKRDQVYATGMSNGGGMVSLLSCQLPERFAAFGIVAGAMYYPAGACTPPSPTPIINIHGDGDRVVPYAGSLQRKLPDISSWSAERAKDNGCSPQPTISHLDAVTTVTSWNSCRNNATVQNIKMRGGGHLWYPDATQMIWKFMSLHTL